MEAYIANLLRSKEVNAIKEPEPVVKHEETKPIIKTGNMSMEDYIYNMAVNEKVTNSDDEDEPELVVEPEQSKPIIETGNMSMEDYIYNMAVNEKVTNSDDEDEPEPEPEPEPEQVVEPEPNNPNIPKLIFIIPYRNREQHLHFFKEHMKKVLSNMKTHEYSMYFIHQQDEREFNRGAMKNIGYLVIKKMYPNNYKNITIVFNDIDTMPYTKNFLDYNTVHGKVKHFYGYKFALGGIVSIKAGDFEKTKGFPNFWAWGYEDNTLKQRVDATKLVVDYSQFYPIMDGNILQLKDGLNRIVSRGEFDKYRTGTSDTFHDISNLVYNIDETTGFINVTNFTTTTDVSDVQTTNFSLESGNAPFRSGRRRPKFGMMF